MLRSSLSALSLVLISAIFGGPTSAWSAPITKHTGDTPEARRATNALNILESQGYCADLQTKSASAFDQFLPEGNDYMAQLHQSGQQFTVRVNPDTGRVTRLR